MTNLPCGRVGSLFQNFIQRGNKEIKIRTLRFINKLDALEDYAEKMHKLPGVYAAWLMLMCSRIILATILALMPRKHLKYIELFFR